MGLFLYFLLCEYVLNKLMNKPFYTIEETYPYLRTFQITRIYQNIVRGVKRSNIGLSVRNMIYGIWKKKNNYPNRQFMV